MDLEKINEEYENLKIELEKTNEEIKIYEANISKLTDNQTIWIGKRCKANKDGNTYMEQLATEEIEKLYEEIQNVHDEALNKMNQIIEIKKKIDDRIKEIKENPEMKKHLDEIMEKKYNRKISKLSKEKDELTNLKQLITEHPTLANNLKGFLVAMKENKALQEELEEMTESIAGVTAYTDINRAREIKAILKKNTEEIIPKNKTPLMEYISKNNLNISEQCINELVDKTFKIDADGKFNLEASLNKQIKGNDKQIANYQIAIENMASKKVEEKQKEEVSKLEETETKNKPNEIPDENKKQPKWYQFIQRFKNWNNKRKQSLLPEKTETIEDELPEIDFEDQTKNDFKNSLKYTIVEDVLNQMEKDTLQEAKKERKSSDIEK